MVVGPRRVLSLVNYGTVKWNIVVLDICHVPCSSIPWALSFGGTFTSQGVAVDRVNNTHKFRVAATF